MICAYASIAASLVSAAFAIETKTHAASSVTALGCCMGAACLILSGVLVLRVPSGHVASHRRCAFVAEARVATLSVISTPERPIGATPKKAGVAAASEMSFATAHKLTSGDCFELFRDSSRLASRLRNAIAIASLSCARFQAVAPLDRRTTSLAGSIWLCAGWPFTSLSRVSTSSSPAWAVSW
jgi:hypothetical protein